MSAPSSLWQQVMLHSLTIHKWWCIAAGAFAKFARIIPSCSDNPARVFGGGWRTFLCNHAPDIAAMDLFVVPTVGFKLLYAFVIVRLGRRELVWINVTTRPCSCPGGQAPVVDLMQDPQTREILRHFHDRTKPTALLCHGPIALVAAMPHAREFRAALIAGVEEKAKEWAKGWQYAGYKMTIFSASEEKWVENDILHAKMYFNMPQALRAAGGEVSTTKVDFEPNVIVDRELITGQNPRSDHPPSKKR